MTSIQLKWPAMILASLWLQSSPLQRCRCLLQLLLQAHHGLCLAPLYYICQGLHMTGPSAAVSACWHLRLASSRLKPCSTLIAATATAISGERASALWKSVET